MPYRVRSKNQERISATGKPSTITTTIPRTIQIGDIEDWENLRDALREGPAGHDVADGNTG